MNHFRRISATVALLASVALAAGAEAPLCAAAPFPGVSGQTGDAAKDFSSALARFETLLNEIASFQASDSATCTLGGTAACFVPATQSDRVRVRALAEALATMNAVPVVSNTTAEAPFSGRLSQLVTSLAAVADARVDLPYTSVLLDAAADEAQPAPEEAPKEEAVAEEAAPVPPEPREAAPVVPVDTTEATSALASAISDVADEGGAQPVMAPRPVWHGDPLDQPIDLSAMDMDLSQAVAILAYKAGINIIASEDLSGTVKVEFRNLPLRRAFEAILQTKGLGILEDRGVYRIVSYAEAVRAERITRIVKLENAQTVDIEKVLKDVVKGSADSTLVDITSNKETNVLVIAGPEGTVQEMVLLAQDLDEAKPELPTVTEAIKLSNSEPSTLLPVVQSLLTPEVGQASVDTRAKHIIVTDLPVVVEQVRLLVTELDVPVKEVSIETMVVDTVLGDEAETGVDWLLDSVRRYSRRSAATGGPAVGNLQELSLATDLNTGTSTAGLLTLALQSADLDWRGVIQAEVRNRNGHLVSNPVLRTMENKPATITIAREIPYVEVQSSEQGGNMTNTEFKDVGTVLEVTPSVTHENDILIELNAKESLTDGEFEGIPIESKREMSSTVRVKNGQTIFVGGLRKNDSTTTVRKVPVLGDLPVMNVLFRSNTRSSEINELVVFLTCSVLDDSMKELDPYQQKKLDEGVNAPTSANLEGDIIFDHIHPEVMRDPAWKWRR